MMMFLSLTTCHRWW